MKLPRLRDVYETTSVERSVYETTTVERYVYETTLVERWYMKLPRLRNVYETTSVERSVYETTSVEINHTSTKGISCKLVSITQIVNITLNMKNIYTNIENTCYPSFCHLWAGISINWLHMTHLYLHFTFSHIIQPCTNRESHKIWKIWNFYSL